MARITSKDVAREAGVSQTTVSFVLNDRSDQTIPPETRQAVLAAAQRLGYVPFAAARTLRSGRSNVVLCVQPDFPIAQAFEEFKITLSQVLGESGYACLFVHSAGSSKPLAELWAHVQPAVVVAFGALPTPDADPVRRAGIALLDNIFEPENRIVTGLDQRAVGRMQVQHLVEQGHERIGFGAGADPRERAFYEPRLLGATDACRELGLDPPITVPVQYSTESARSAVETWTRDSRVTAVAAFNDLVALAILAACRSDGVTVPDDLAIIGVDNLLAGSMTGPALTTIAINLTVPARSLSAKILEVAGAAAAVPAGWDRQPILTLVPRETT